jgi:hypothetical protein
MKYGELRIKQTELKGMVDAACLYIFEHGIVNSFKLPPQTEFHPQKRPKSA